MNFIIILIITLLCSTFAISQSTYKSSWCATDFSEDLFSSAGDCLNDFTDNNYQLVRFIDSNVHTPINDPYPCFAGENITVWWGIKLNTTTQAIVDINDLSWVVVEEGEDAFNGTMCQSWIWGDATTSTLSSQNTLNPVSGPWYDEDDDECGDVYGIDTENTVVFPLRDYLIACPEIYDDLTVGQNLTLSFVFGGNAGGGTACEDSSLNYGTRWTQCAELTTPVVVTLSPCDGVDTRDDTHGTIYKEQTVLINVLNNDFRTYRGPVDATSLEIIVQPSRGVATVDVDTYSISYTNTGGSGGSEDSFTYRICNVCGNCDTATVTLNAPNITSAQLAIIIAISVLVGILVLVSVLCCRASSPTYEGGYANKISQRRRRRRMRKRSNMSTGTSLIGSQMPYKKFTLN